MRLKNPFVFCPFYNILYSVLFLRRSLQLSRAQNKTFIKTPIAAQIAAKNKKWEYGSRSGVTQNWLRRSRKLFWGLLPVGQPTPKLMVGKANHNVGIPRFAG
jgi:hypothetical protein